MSSLKTNAMRVLDKAGIPYEVKTYPHHGEAVDGLQVAQLLQQDPTAVFKTLVTIANTKEYFVFVIPVLHELDLKKCAKAVGVKRIEMIHVKDIVQVSGYVRGGCSPLAMKKNYKTVLHESCLQHSIIMFSGGKIGIQILLSPQKLRQVLCAQCFDVIK